jgi:hypothetical protein
LEKFMTIKIKELVSNGSVLIDLTDAESGKVNGGYTALIIAGTGNVALAAQAAGLVAGNRNTQTLFRRQLNIGVPRNIVEDGAFLANTFGGGRYTLPVTSSKLEG